MYTRVSLLTPTQSLCKSFATNPPFETLLSTFTTNPPPQVHEHGLPSLTPFLGRTFTGRDGITQYFKLLNETLGIEEMEFDDEKDWVVDIDTKVVCLRGKARFVWKGTGEQWDEMFMYRIGLAEERGGGEEGEGKLKVKVYEVWADTGAAYLARKGALRDLLEEELNQ